MLTDIDQRLKIVIQKSYLSLPLSVIPPPRPFPLWKTVPEPKVRNASLLTVLRESIEKSIKGCNDKIGVWFSGGIDSTTLLYLLNTIYDNKKIVPIFLDFKCYPDEVERVNLVEQYIGIRIKVVNFTLKDHFSLFEKSVLNARQPVDFSTQVIFSGDLAKKEGCDFVLSALGLDEIMGGYPAHVNSNNKNFPKIEKELLEECQSKFVWNNISQAGIDVKFPFLSEDVVSYGRSLPRSSKIRNKETKIQLREELKGKLPEKIVESGRIVGSKRGFTPLINLWWEEGLSEWAWNELDKLGIQEKRIIFSSYLISKFIKRGNLWQLIRLASLPTWKKLYNEGKFN